MISSATRAVRAATAVLVAAFAIGPAACANPAAPSVNVAFTQTDLRVGAGAAAASGKVISVNYTGWLYDGTEAEKKGAQFDASKAGRPFVFSLGAGQVIAGWDQGVVGMRIGGLRRLIIPASLAYGRQGAGDVIPPNASLVFEIELVAVF